MPTFDSRVLAIQIDRAHDEVYEFCANPANFARWASGLGEAVACENGQWIGWTPHGRIRVQIAPRNDYGVLDHVVTADNGAEVYIPLRVVASGDGCELQFTLFRQPGMDDETFAHDAEWVMRDLRALKRLMES